MRWKNRCLAPLLVIFLFSGCPQPQGSSSKVSSLPDAPKDLRVKPGYKKLIVSWDAASGADSYEIFFSETETIPDAGAVFRESATSTVTLDQLNNGQTYYIYVRSKNNFGVSGFSPPAQGKPELKAPTPSLIRGNERLSVGWVTETGVQYEVFCNNAKWPGLSEIREKTGGVEISGLENSTAYSVWIKAIAHTGETEIESQASSEIPEGELTAPAGFVYVPGGTVLGSESYAISVTVPNASDYMNTGKTLTKKGVFVEGRKVTLDSLFVAKYETTRELWYNVQSWAKDKNYSFQNEITEPNEADKNKPVTGISWRDAIVWCNAYSEKSGMQPVYYYGGEILRNSQNAACDNAEMKKNNSGFRLPTEVEREFAARGGDPGKADWVFTFSGSNDADDVWHHGNSPYQIREVGLKKTNRLGICDLSGNVQEWGWDWMNYNVAVSAETPPDGEEQGGRFSQKPMAGGGVGSNLTMSCVADRWSFTTNYTDSYVGFRVIRKAQ